MKSTRRYYIILFALVLLFAAPGLTAYFLYFHPQWLSTTTTNKGQFVNPPVQIASLQNKPDKWQFVLWQTDACEMACMKQMDQLARVRLALGRRLYDVDLTLMLSEQATPLSQPEQQALVAQGVQVIQLSATETKQLISVYNKPMFFIANPDQFLVLAYLTTSQPNDLFHDIKQLLTKGTSS